MWGRAEVVIMGDGRPVVGAAIGAGPSSRLPHKPETQPTRMIADSDDSDGAADCDTRQHQLSLTCSEKPQVSCRG